MKTFILSPFLSAAKITYDKYVLAAATVVVLVMIAEKPFAS